MAISKKISQLNPLTSASLNTQVVGVDNGSTIRVSLNTIKDAVATTLNDTNDARLDSLEQYTSSAVGSNLSSLNSFTSSYFTDSASFSNRIALATNEQSFAGLISGSSQLTSSFDTRYTLSGSVTQTTWDNISGKPSGIVSQSTDLNPLNNFTQSFESISASLNTRINSATNEQELTSLNSFTSSYNTGSFTGSFKGTFTGSISGTANNANYSAYVLTQNSNTNQDFSLVFTPSGSNGYLQTYTDGLSNLLYNPSTNRLKADYIKGAIEATNGVISGSSQLPAGLISGSSQLPNGIVSSSSQLTESYDSRYTISGSVQSVVLPIDLISSSAQISGLGFISSSIISAGTISSSAQITSLGFVSGSYLTSLSGAISSSTQLTSSFELKGSGIYSSSAQLPVGIISGSSQLPVGLVSGSSQLTASYDLRYAAFGAGGTIPAGTISGSSQLTASYDGRYLQTGSFVSYTTNINAFTASHNLWTSSVATTGSNSFNGNQIVTGSLTVSSVATISSSIAANASALTLSSGSNLYIQNNGFAQITGSLIVSGSSQLTGSLNIMSGSIVMPNRTAFRVVGGGTTNNLSTTQNGDGTLNTNNFISSYVQGSGFDISTGIFTAPIAGLYSVHLVARNSGYSSGISQLAVIKNNDTAQIQVMIEFAPNSTMNHTGGSTISYLAVGDTLRVKVTAGQINYDGNDNWAVAYIG